MDNDQSIDEVLIDAISGFDDSEGKVKMSVAEELVERLPYKPEYEDPLGDL